MIMDRADVQSVYFLFKTFLSVRATHQASESVLVSPLLFHLHINHKVWSIVVDARMSRSIVVSRYTL
jgi:hypothetical protein